MSFTVDRMITDWKWPDNRQVIIKVASVLIHDVVGGQAEQHAVIIEIPAGMNANQVKVFWDVGGRQ